MTHDDKVKYTFGDLVRMYKWKNSFSKMSGSRFTEKVFNEREVKRLHLIHIYSRIFMGKILKDYYIN